MTDAAAAEGLILMLEVLQGGSEGDEGRSLRADTWFCFPLHSQWLQEHLACKGCSINIC